MRYRVKSIDDIPFDLKKNGKLFLGDLFRHNAWYNEKEINKMLKQWGKNTINIDLFLDTVQSRGKNWFEDVFETEKEVHNHNFNDVLDKELK